MTTLFPQRLEKAAEAMERGVCATCGTPAVGEGGGYTACECNHPVWREATNSEKAHAAISAYLGEDAVVVLPSRIDFEKEARDLKISIAENSYPAADGTADIDNHAIPIIAVTLRNLFDRAMLSAELTERDAG